MQVRLKAEAGWYLLCAAGMPSCCNNYIHGCCYVHRQPACQPAAALNVVSKPLLPLQPTFLCICRALLLHLLIDKACVPASVCCRLLLLLAWTTATQQQHGRCC